MEVSNISINEEDPNQKAAQISGLSGICNMGNTCYMNSAIQALSHNYPLTYFLFQNKSEILETLKRNAPKNLRDVPIFDLNNTESIIPKELREKLHSEDYSKMTLSEEECRIIFNHTITVQLMRLLEHMWNKNCVVIPTSFRFVFSEVRDKFFCGYGQHDAEEAYSCIIQQMQEELAEKTNIKFTTNKKSVQEFLYYQNQICQQIKNETTLEKKKELYQLFQQKKREMAEESLIVEAYREMKKYYDTNNSRITGIYSGFLHSSTSCPNTDCNFSSNKFDPFLHLSLPIPPITLQNIRTATSIEDCMTEYCKEEILDENNLWKCEGCNEKVRGIKKLQIWTNPLVLVIQLKRFGMSQNIKNDRLIMFPVKDFDISSMISPHRDQFNSESCNKYRLQCVINHSGNMYGGHYYTYCMDENTDKWYEYNDNIVTKIKREQVVSKKAYILYYIREDMIGTK